jgi:hypothetical protein
MCVVTLELDQSISTSGGEGDIVQVRAKAAHGGRRRRRERRASARVEKDEDGEWGVYVYIDTLWNREIYCVFLYYLVNIFKSEKEIHSKIAALVVAYDSIY